jgi:hypothetical protein
MVQHWATAREHSYLPGDGFQHGTHYVGHLGVAGEPQYEPSGIVPPMRSQQSVKRRHKDDTWAILDS